jgi:hypothetical protein
MAYPCRANQCDNNKGTTCPVIARFSSAEGTYNRLPVGDRRNDCAKHIRRFAPMISKFYPPTTSCESDETFCQIGSLLCFAPEMTVRVKGIDSPVTIKDLQVGNEVLTLNKHQQLVYQPIYSINHYHRSRATEFLQIMYTGDEEEDNKQNLLELSASHLLFVRGNNYPIPAHEIQVGDYVQVVRNVSTILAIEGDDNSGALPSRSFSYARVVQVKSVVRDGFYNPLTAEGTIVVNRVVASTYSSLLSTLSQRMSNTPTIFSSRAGFLQIGKWDIISHHRLSHILLSPYRFFSLLPSWKANLANYPHGLLVETNENLAKNKQEELRGKQEEEEYLSQYSYFGLWLLSWWYEKHEVIQVLVLLLMIFFFTICEAVCAALESILENYQTLAAAAVVFATWIGYHAAV